MGNCNRMSENFDVAIIGAGASGLAAALTLKRRNPAVSVAIVEKKEKAGKKLATTGNGRCNLSNTACGDSDKLRSFFDESGILLRSEDGGRLYPYCEDARELSELLACECEAEGVHILLNHDVKKVEADSKNSFGGGFLLFVEEKVESKALSEKVSQNSKRKNGRDAGDTVISKVLRAKRVLIATGGKSYPMLGTTGDGYVMARSLGHSVSPLAPGLTAVKVLAAADSVAGKQKRGADAVSSNELQKLKGVRVKACVSLLFDGKELLRESGEVQFREDSVSGICVMNLSNHIKPQKKCDAVGKEILSFEGYLLRMDLAPEFTAEMLALHLKKLSANEGMTVLDALRTIVKEKIAYALALRVGINADMPALRLSDADIRSIVHELKEFSFGVSGLAGWKEAQLTCGGVCLDEIEEESGQSKLIKGLYFSGEVLDYAGPCGGFNLHHAWLTGIRAGEAIAESM